MAGRRAHIEAPEFTEFLESIPEEARAGGFWRVKRETMAANGGVVHSYLGFTQFNHGESYDTLRNRIKEEFGGRSGPGTYYLIPCNARKQELKNTDQVKLVYSKEEIPMPEPNVTQNANPLEAIKKAHKEVAEVKAMAMQEKLFNKLLNDGDKENDVKESSGVMSGGMQDILMYKMLFNDDSKKSGSAADHATQTAVLKEVLESKVDAKLSALEAKLVEALKPRDDSRFERLLEKLVESQTKPRDDSHLEKLLERVLLKEDARQQENAFQSMMTLMIQQQNARDKEREADERRREAERIEERKRMEEDRKAELKRLEEQARLERDRWEQEEKRREEERKAERAKLEEERRLEREKFLKELEERQRRFDAEISLRREEIKNEAVKAKEYIAEQQKMQLQLLGLFKENKDSSLDITRNVVETLTGAGLQSMKTAQQAAESIMSIAKKVDKSDKDDDEGSGIGEILKTLAPLAVPVIGSMMNQDQNSRLLQQLGQVAGAGGLEQILGQVMGAGGGRGLSGLSGLAGLGGLERPKMKEAPTERPSRSAKASEGGIGHVIAKYLQSFPILKDALIGNLTDGLGVDMYLPIILGLDQPTLEGIIANVPHTVVMAEVKKVCNPQEQMLVDQNPEWFRELRSAMIEELRGDMEESSAPPAPGPKKVQVQVPSAQVPQAGHGQ